MVIATITIAESDVIQAPGQDDKKTKGIEENNQKILEETSLLPQ